MRSTFPGPVCYRTLGLANLFGQPDYSVRRGKIQCSPPRKLKTEHGSGTLAAEAERYGTQEQEGKKIESAEVDFKEIQIESQGSQAGSEDTREARATHGPRQKCQR